MSYQLRKLEELTAVFKISSSKEDRTNCLEILDVEIARIKDAFIQKVFNTESERIVQDYIQHHQVRLIDLCDQVLNLIPEIERHHIYKRIGVTKECPILLYQGLEKLLDFIEKHFSKYFDQNASVPQSYFHIACRDFEERVPGLKTDLVKSQLDPKLISSLLKPFHDFLNQSRKQQVSFRKLMYLKELMDLLIKTAASLTNSQDSFLDLISTLVYINFNSYRLFISITNILKEEVQSLETMDQQLDQLSWYSKSINQCPVRPNIEYDPEPDSLKYALIEWLDAEYEYLSRKQQLTINLDDESKVSEKDNFKLFTTLTVEQLGYFIRVMLETDVIQNKSAKQVVSFFAKYVRTKRMQTISPSSLWNRTYQPSAGTINKVNEFLSKMMNYRPDN